MRLPRAFLLTDLLTPAINWPRLATEREATRSPEHSRLMRQPAARCRSSPHHLAGTRRGGLRPGWPSLAPIEAQRRRHGPVLPANDQRRLLRRLAIANDHHWLLTRKRLDRSLWSVYHPQRALLVPVVLVVGIALTACAGNGPVFADPGRSSVGSRNTTADIEDVGLGQLHNVTSKRVRLLGVSLVSAPRAVRLLTTLAYAPSFGGQVGVIDGNLAKLCRSPSPAHPLTDTVAAPHADTNWALVLAIRFAKPGQYTLNRVKISYETNGQKGWQYEHFNFTATVTAARPGTESRFAGCP